MDGAPASSWSQNVTREEAEEQLAQHCAGTFLFRPCKSHRPGSMGDWCKKVMALSIRTEQGIKHFMVTQHRTRGAWNLVGKPRQFGSMDELVAFYTATAPSRRFESRLTKPCPAHNLYEHVRC